MRRPKPLRPARKSSLSDVSRTTGTNDVEPVVTGDVFVTADDPNPLGNANPKEIEAVAAESFGADPDLDAPEVTIGLGAVAKAIAARIRNADSLGDPKTISVFLISDHAREVGGGLGAAREPIVNNGSISFAGRLWIAAPTFNSGYWIAFKEVSTAGIFKEVADRGVGATPALVFDPNATDAELRFYPKGLNDAEVVRQFVIAQHSFSLQGLDKILRRFHESNIRTPDAAIGDQSPWTDGNKYVPRPRTEQFLQGLLKSALNIAFDEPFAIYFEMAGTEGRCDLMLVSRPASQPNTWQYHAVLELKVLRSLSSGAKPVLRKMQVAAVEGGLLQAIAYKTEHHAEYGMLCCFDMRLPNHCNGDACFDVVQVQAADCKIELRRYRLYGSSADWRQDAYSKSTTA